ncbi:alpha-2,3-sialyltransferase, partial [Campylobacter jejuni]|nr:alpha-2,3-sialyltransferase [Campylobacter jejuni]
MSREIQEFIEKLKDWKNNFSIQDYDYAKYNCEVADIAKWQKENNVNELINFWNEKIKEDYFELKHPIYNDVVTRAVYNVNADNFNNWVFFIDEKNKYPFCIGQTCSLINTLIADNNFFIINEGWEGMCVGSVYSLSNFLKNNLINFKFEKINFGFTFQNT